MSAKKHTMGSYKKFLLNRSTLTTPFVEYIENLVASEEESADYTFHKIMVHSWTEDNDILFETMNEYFNVWFIPVNVSKQRDITTFYTCSLNLILRLTRLDFMFSYDRNMYSVNVLFNDKTSVDLFNNDIAIDDIVSSIVSGRFDEKQSLDLSDFSNDQELTDNKICFYKLPLLANFKILMLRVGKDTKSLNLSYNQLVQPPVDVMNFFIKGDLTEINLSYNNIASISDLLRVTSKIEKLWIEGNPLCEDVEPSVYVKQITMKFPRLTELDGVRLNEFGVGFPLCRNFMVTPTKHLRMVVEKFLTIYFSHYDTFPRKFHLDGFYDDQCTMSITTGFTAAEKTTISPPLSNFSRNLLTYVKGISKMYHPMNKMYPSKAETMSILSVLPRTQHDPTTFTVDLLKHDKKCMILVVDGVFKDVDTTAAVNVFQFRRTFVFSAYKHSQMTTVYKIKHEMFHIALPTDQQLSNSFKFAIKNMSTFELVNPEKEETEAIVKAFCQITKLKKDESEKRLKQKNWDLKSALTIFIADVTADKVGHHMYMEDEAFSDTSSINDDEMVD